MDMHTAAIYAEDRFGHKGSIKAMLGGNLFDYQSVSHDLVGHSQSIRITHINFMLAHGYLVMGLIHTDTHLFQC